MQIITKIREIRVETGSAPSKKVDLFLLTDEKKVIQNSILYIQKLANVGEINFVNSKEEVSQKSISAVLDKCEIFIPLGELVDKDKELARLNGELSKIESEIARAHSKLANSGFLAKAPKALVDSEREKLDKYIDMRTKVLNSIKDLESLS
jgi:valyl-tRNA synthetase